MNTSTPRINLRRALAQHGFESNDDYEFALRCLFEAELSHLRVLHIDGTAGRRKTAFATALARALEYPHILYHDFTRTEPQAPVVVVPETDEETGPLEPPMSAFERVVTEACAYSEAARTVLVHEIHQQAVKADHLDVIVRRQDLGGELDPFLEREHRILAVALGHRDDDPLEQQRGSAHQVAMSARERVEGPWIDRYCIPHS